jgi:replication initiator protein RepSA
MPLDDAAPIGSARRPSSFGAGELGALVRQAGSLAALPVRTQRRTMTLRFGEQLDVRALDDVSGRRVAAYLAKYVTKSVGDFGLTARRLHEGVVGELAVSEHVRRILHTIAMLARESEYHELGTWLHTLGYRGHITTKTRGFSTTMGELRARRDAWRREQRSPEGDGEEATPDSGETEWRYKGCGHATEGERYLALSAADRNREMRRAAREALSARNSDE